MARRTRSPAYPSLNLAEAINRAQAFFNQEGRAPVPPEVAVKAWGYNTLNGASARVLAAVRQYGLLEDVNGDVRVSERALTILLEPDISEERLEAMREAAQQPQVFNDILTAFPEELPSEQGLVAHLVRKSGFTEEGARKVNSVLRATLELAGNSEGDRSAHGASETPVEELSKTQQTSTASAPERPADSGDLNQPMEWRLPLIGGNVAVLSFFRDPDASDIVMLKSYLDVVEDRLKEVATLRPDVA